MPQNSSLSAFSRSNFAYDAYTVYFFDTAAYEVNRLESTCMANVLYRSLPSASSNILRH